MTSITYTAIRSIHADHTQSELVSNGDFAAGSTGWTATDWTVGSGVADHNTGNTTALSQTLNGATLGYDYVLTFTIAGTSAGSLTPSIGTGTGSAVSSNGNYEQTITATTTKVLAFTPTSDFDGNITNISVQVATSWSMDITATSLTRKWPIRKNDHVSLDGTTETIFHRRDQEWDYNSDLISTANLTAAYWEEMIDSICGGEIFTFDARGTVASPDNPVSAIMVGEPRWRQVGALYHRVGFTVREL